MKAAERACQRATSTAFLFVLISNTSLGAIESTTGESVSPEAAICEIKQWSLSPPPMNDELRPADLGLRPAVDAVPMKYTFESIVGTASFYDYPQETASGEQYDPTAFTAAAQLEIREMFGGIRFGRLYQPAYAIAEHAGKKLILKFNDVGPLLPGRKFDLSRAAMEYFEGIEKGLLEDFKVTPLPLGRIYATGPVTDATLIALGIGEMPTAVAQPTPGAESSVLAGDPAAASAAAEQEPAVVPVSPYPIDDFVPAPIGDVAALAVMHPG